MKNTRVAERIVTGHDSTWTYLCAGKGPPVVWLHGLWGEPGWDLHHQRLAERYTVYAPALPGYHGSSFPQWLVDCEDAATLLIDFLEALKLERPILMGYSLGGWIAAEAALIQGAGHFPHVEQPAAFLPMLMEFLRPLSARGMPERRKDWLSTCPGISLLTPLGS